MKKFIGLISVLLIFTALNASEITTDSIGKNLTSLKGAELKEYIKGLNGKSVVVKNARVTEIVNARESLQVHGKYNIGCAVSNDDIRIHAELFAGDDTAKKIKKDQRISFIAEIFDIRPDEDMVFISMKLVKLL